MSVYEALQHERQKQAEGQAPSICLKVHVRREIG